MRIFTEHETEVLACSGEFPWTHESDFRLLEELFVHVMEDTLPTAPDMGMRIVVKNREWSGTIQWVERAGLDGMWCATHIDGGTMGLRSLWGIHDHLDSMEAFNLLCWIESVGQFEDEREIFPDGSWGFMFNNNDLGFTIEFNE